MMSKRIERKASLENKRAKHFKVIRVSFSRKQSKRISTKIKRGASNASKKVV